MVKVKLLTAKQTDEQRHRVYDEINVDEATAKDWLEKGHCTIIGKAEKPSTNKKDD